MKYTITINQKQAVELGLTNINQLFIFDIITTASSWAKTVIIDNQHYYWVARQAIIAELPILSLKPDTVRRHLNGLAELGLIEYKKNGNMDCVKLTNKGKKYQHENISEEAEELPFEAEADSSGAKVDSTYQTTISINKQDNHNVGLRTLSLLNEKAGTNYKSTDVNIKLITGRLNEGYTEDDITAVINTKCEEWMGTVRQKYLRPATLFGATKFSQYAGQVDIEEEDWTKPRPQTANNDGVTYEPF